VARARQAAAQEDRLAPEERPEPLRALTRATLAPSRNRPTRRPSKVGRARVQGARGSTSGPSYAIAPVSGPSVDECPYVDGAGQQLLASRAVSDAVSPLALAQINVVVRDMRASLTFYRLLGLSINEIPLAEWAPHHASAVTSNGVQIEFDSVAFAKQWNPGLDEARLGTAALPFFHVASRGEVDRVYARVTGAGYRSQKAPEDAFWGARYAILEDPDGNSVGIMSSIDESMRRPPPPPPRA
jgi:uncharacterized glyoxalase superfamily protein PhnB